LILCWESVTGQRSNQHIEKHVSGRIGFEIRHPTGASDCQEAQQNRSFRLIGSQSTCRARIHRPSPEKEHRTPEAHR
jgi:hypothetical protein